jgi:hypothetical protein
MAEPCCGNTCSCGCDTDRRDKLCKLAKPANRFDMDKYLMLVNAPLYICRCCGRLANKAESLCGPILLKNNSHVPSALGG